MRLTTILILSCLISLPAYPQDKRRERADQLFEHMAYMEAAQIYEKIARKGEAGVEVLSRLGDAYYFNARYPEAASWYGELFALGGDPLPVHYFRYSQSLKAKGDEIAARELLTQYGELTQSTQYTSFLEDNFDAKSQLENGMPGVEVHCVGINSIESDFGAAIFEGKLVFTSSREEIGSAKRRFLWTNKAFTNVYIADSTEEGNYEKAEEFLKEVNSKFNESTPVFTRDGNTMYFTRNNMENGEKRADASGMVRLKIYRVTRSNGEWGEAEELGFNSDKFSCAHPALSPDDKILVFVSDRPSGMGQSDLYRVTIEEDGSLGEPVSLGEELNTPGRETFPFISEEGELYFASDGHMGLGGLDIFTASLDDGNASGIQNVGTPFNSPYDDFAFLLDPSSRSGFFSSNREGGTGSDDIYRFTILQPEVLPEPVVEEPVRRLVLQGNITDIVNGNPLSGIRLKLLHAVERDSLGAAISDAKGFYRIELPDIRYYELQTASTTHKPLLELFDLEEKVLRGDTLRLDLKLTPVQDAKALAQINEIYFDFDKSDIRPDAAKELDKVVRLMLVDYPEMTIRIESHTDPLGSHQYNDRLSQLRAASTYRYLVSKGVPKERILSFRGFGKRKPLNDCRSKEDCSPEELERNRRTEMPIVQISNDMKFEETKDHP